MRFFKCDLCGNITTALSDRMDPTDRSIAPEEIISIIPTARRIRNELASRILTTFFHDKNDDVVNDNITPIRIITAIRKRTDILLLFLFSCFICPPDTLSEESAPESFPG